MLCHVCFSSKRFLISECLDVCTGNQDWGINPLFSDSSVFCRRKKIWNMNRVNDDRMFLFARIWKNVVRHPAFLSHHIQPNMQTQNSCKNCIFCGADSTIADYFRMMLYFGLNADTK